VGDGEEDHLFEFAEAVVGHVDEYNASINDATGRLSRDPSTVHNAQRGPRVSTLVAAIGDIAHR
jgi:hypothetical protein